MVAVVRVDSVNSKNVVLVTPAGSSVVSVKWRLIRRSSELVATETEWRGRYFKYNE
jgi:hypothetical protein